MCARRLLCCGLFVLHFCLHPTKANAQWEIAPAYVFRAHGPQIGVGMRVDKELAQGIDLVTWGLRTHVSYSRGTAIYEHGKYHSGLGDLSVTASKATAAVRVTTGLGAGVEVYGLRSRNSRVLETTNQVPYGIAQIDVVYLPDATVSPSLGFQVRRLLDGYDPAYRFPHDRNVVAELIIAFHIHL